MSILKYQKKPVVIEAIQLTSENLLDCIYFICPDFCCLDKTRLDKIGSNQSVTIETSGGSLDVRVGDYIVKESKDDFYIYKPDIFLATYEPEKTHVINLVAPNSQTSKSIKINHNIRQRRG